MSSKLIKGYQKLVEKNLLLNNFILLSAVSPFYLKETKDTLYLCKVIQISSISKESIKEELALFAKEILESNCDNNCLKSSIPKKGVLFIITTVDRDEEIIEVLELEEAPHIKETSQVDSKLKEMLEVKDDLHLIHLIPVIASIKTFRWYYHKEYSSLIREACPPMELAILLKKRPAIFTWLIMITNIFLWLLIEKAGGPKDIVNLIKFGANDFYYIIGKQEYWRLVTSIFIHIGAIHLFINSYALLCYAPFLEEKLLGSLWFLFVYLLSGIIGSCFSIVNMWYSEVSISAGASGAIFGLIGVIASFTIINQKILPHKWKEIINTNLFLIIAVNLILGITVPQIDLLAHLGGFLTGLIMGWIIFSSSFKEEVIATILLIILFLCSVVVVLPNPVLKWKVYSSYGDILLSKGNYNDAKNLYLKAIKLNSSSSLLHINLAKAYIFQKNNDLANKELILALTYTSDTRKQAQIYALLGFIAQRNGNFEQALIYFHKSLSLFPSNLFIYREIGKIYLLQNRFSEAISVLHRAIKLAPGEADLYSTLGYIYLAKEDTLMAEKKFLQALKLDKNNFLSFLGLLDLYTLEGENKLWGKIWVEFQSIYPASPYPYIIKAQKWAREGRFKEAISLAEFALKKDPYSPYLYTTLGEFYYRNGDYLNATENLTKALAFSSTYLNTYTLLISSLYMQNALDYSSLLKLITKSNTPLEYKNYALAQFFTYRQEFPFALVLLEQINQRNPYLIEVYLLKAQILYSLGLPQKSLETLRDGYKIDPYNDELNYALGFLMWREGEEKIASFYLNKLKDPSSTNTLCAKAILSLINNNLKEAEQNLNSIKKSYPNCPACLFIAGILEAKKGQQQKALNYFKEVIKLEPFNREARELWKSIY